MNGNVALATGDISLDLTVTLAPLPGAQVSSQSRDNIDPPTGATVPATQKPWNAQ